MAIGPQRPNDAQLAGWYDEIQEIRLHTRDLVHGLSATQLTWRPGPGKWSIVECLDHLVVTAREAGAHQARSIERARADRVVGTGPFSPGWFGRWFVTTTGPGRARPVPSPAVFAPRSNLDPAQVLVEFEGTQNDLQRLFESADGLDLGRVKARSAASRFLRFNLAAWFASTVGHERRHLQQIERLKAHPGFPTR